MIKPARDMSRLSFEDALRELEALVQRLEQGDVRLEDSLKLYRRGEALKRHCAAKLAEAQAQIQHLTESGDPQPAVAGKPAGAKKPAAADKPASSSESAFSSNNDEPSL